MKFTIPRSKWGRFYLYDPKTGCSCVLGHCLLQLGFSPEVLNGETTPAEVGATLFTEDLVTRAVAINDSYRDEWEIELELTELFHAHDYELEFVDG